MAKDTKKPKKTKNELQREIKMLRQTVNYFYELAKTYAQIVSLIAEHYNPDDKDSFLQPFFDKLEEQQTKNKKQGEN